MSDFFATYTYKNDYGLVWYDVDGTFSMCRYFRCASPPPFRRRFAYGRCFYKKNSSVGAVCVRLVCVVGDAMTEPGSSRRRLAEEYTEYGTTWNRITQPKARAWERAHRLGHKCFLQRSVLGTPGKDGSPREFRNFGSYPSWKDALASLSVLRSDSRHVYEIIPHGRPCKPYLDLDSEHGPPPPCQTPTDVVVRTEDLVRRIFHSDFGITLPDSAFFWSLSPNQQKFSMHLVVSTHEPQLVYHSNHRQDQQGAYHLPRRLAELDSDCIGKIVDLGVYSKDREMRLVGCSKALKPQSVLHSYRPLRKQYFAHPDEIISCLDSSSLQVLSLSAAFHTVPV